MNGKRLLAALGAAAALFAIGGGTVAPARAESGRVYRVYLSNNFAGNDWRQQMLRSVQVAARKPPLAGRVDLKIDNVETTTQAQINSLNNIIRTHPDAILVDAGSGDALNPTIERACKLGIVVVTFDQVATADCAYKLQSDLDTMALNQATWMAAVLGGQGRVLLDRGLPGAPAAARMVKIMEDVLKQHPGITIAGYFEGKFALGPEQSGVADLLAANPKIDGVLTLAYGTGAMKALQQAGRPMVPIVAAAFNGTAIACVQQNVKCVLGANPPYLSAEALKLAVQVLDGKVPANRMVLLNSPLLTTDEVQANFAPGSRFEKIELGKTAFPDQPPGLSLPVSPSWVSISPAEAIGGS